MPRPARQDAPRTRHHVMNRALARRTLFETQGDVRSFLAQLAAAVRRGELWIHAYSLVTTHFHLLVTSVDGRLSEAMRRIESAYVRVFNRLRERDGPLFRGRFRSKLVESDAYWWRVVRYIDQNAVEAGLSSRPEDFAHGSARYYVRGDAPRWLDRGPIERDVTSRTREPYCGSDYLRVFGHALSTDERAFVETRLERGDGRDDPSGGLLLAAAPSVRRWLEDRTRLADGTRPGHPIVDVAAALAATSAHGAALPPRGLETMTVGLLRELCGMTMAHIGVRLGKPRSTTRETYEAHCAAMGDERYADVVARAATTAIRSFDNAWSRHSGPGTK